MGKVRVGGVLFLSVSVLVLGAGPACADAALAIGLPGNVAVNGFVSGSAYNAPSYEAARRDALQRCQSDTTAPQATRNLCTVITSFRNHCYAIALDPAAGTPGVGWSVAETRAEAERQATAFCRATAGAGRAGFCQTTTVECDGTAN